MVKADFSGEFLNSDNAKENDVITIIGKATVKEKEHNGRKYTSTDIPIEINKKPKTYSPSRESGQRMIEAWGEEMDNWVGKQATIKHVLKQIAGVTKTYIESYPLGDPK